MPSFGRLDCRRADPARVGKIVPRRVLGEGLDHQPSGGGVIHRRQVNAGVRVERALDHPQRGKWFNVGMPIKLSASPALIRRSPTLGEHTDEVLTQVLGYDEAKIAQLKNAGAFSAPPKKAA